MAYDGGANSAASGAYADGAISAASDAYVGGMISVASGPTTSTTSLLKAGAYDDDSRISAPSGAYAVGTFPAASGAYIGGTISAAKGAYNNVAIAPSRGHTAAAHSRRVTWFKPTLAPGEPCAAACFALLGRHVVQIHGRPR